MMYLYAVIHQTLTKPNYDKILRGIHKMTNSKQTQAIVIGGSMSGLLTARVLSDHFQHVMVIERDPVHDQPESRKGQPQTRHLHILLASGLQIITDLFPGIDQALVAGGAMINDMGHIPWYQYNGYRKQFTSGTSSVLMSRPFLEWHVRQQLLTRPNVTLISECEVKELLTTADHRQITAVLLHHRQSNQTETVTADLVIDTSGRGSAAGKWLETLGYGQPPETRVKINLGYATRTYRRQPGDLNGASGFIIAPTAPEGKQGAILFPIEGDRWILTAGSAAGAPVPTDESSFNEYFRTLPVPDIYHLIQKAEPLSPVINHKFPMSLRRHYEKMRRFPEGYLVLGDALCSFNPVYGQGMSSAAMQAAALGRLLTAQGGLQPGLWRSFFKEAAKIVDAPWQLVVGEDFRYPETEGIKPAGTDFINRYMDKLHVASQHDTVVYKQLLRVLHLLDAPTTLFKPSIVWRVLRRKRPFSSPTTNNPTPAPTAPATPYPSR